MILLPLMILWAPRPMQFTASARWVLLVFFALALTVGAPNGLGPECYGVEWPEPSAADSPAASNPLHGSSPLRSVAKGGELSREGTRVAGLVGTFREIGRRWTFIADDDQASYRLLENQTLERICRSIQEDPYDIRWKVGGELTEFMDENFLILDHAQRAAK
ncbi:hypothetical protein [Candidatus Laterigemmans baculatus]|nr:hypothetical protein [Candidatus Laterigemmans baculatus]